MTNGKLKTLINQLVSEKLVSSKQALPITMLRYIEAELIDHIMSFKDKKKFTATDTVEYISRLREELFIIESWGRPTPSSVSIMIWRIITWVRKVRIPASIISKGREYIRARVCDEFEEVTSDGIKALLNTDKGNISSVPTITYGSVGVLFNAIESVLDGWLDRRIAKECENSFRGVFTFKLLYSLMETPSISKIPIENLIHYQKLDPVDGRILLDSIGERIAEIFNK